jgi:hypothetical protein
LGSLSHSEARNRKQSPLLRLPGELRNKVYEYAMSEITVTVFPYKGGYKPYHLQAHLNDTPSSTRHVTDVLSLTRVCRQVRAETCHLPLRSITFHVASDRSFHDFLQVLSEAERNAISTIQISTPDAQAGGASALFVKYSRVNDYKSQGEHLDLLEWSYALAFDRLGGLKRVVVEQDKQWYYARAQQHLLREGIISCTKGRNIEIIVPKPQDKVWSDEKVCWLSR